MNKRALICRLCGFVVDFRVDLSEQSNRAVDHWEENHDSDDDIDPSDPERFCDRCAAGVDSHEHHEKCVLTGFAIDGESAPLPITDWFAPNPYFPVGSLPQTENGETT